MSGPAPTPGPGAAGTNLVYDTARLVAVVPNLKRPTKFLLDRFFPNIINSETEFVAIDVDVGKRRIAPFVSPLVEGKLVEQRRMQTNIFKPAYIKDKRAPDLRKPVRRMIGERIGGELTGAEREMANLEAEMTDQIDLIDRRLEWMAAQVLSTGTVLIKGEGFPTSLVDFGRAPSLTVALTGTAQWTNANVIAGNASPTTNIEAWQRQILKESGAKVTDIIFTTSSWEGFIADPVLKGAIYYPKLSEFGNAIDPGAKIERGAVYKGRWGQYDLWIYNEWYVDMGTEGGNTDQEYPMLTDGTVLLSGPDMMGTRAFASIMDPNFNYQALPYAPKTWTIEDPAQRFIMMQSAPITIPGRVNAALAATVCSPVYT
ncbi:MAG TPA: major capsid protein [Xanthobacteraceae bacterium]|nr:major capsid protein [Xanthobacteraceae bacterium]